MFDSIIFDVDGTIWDTTPIVEKAWNAALDECGLSYAHITKETLRGLFGLPMDEIIRRILPKESDEVRMKFKPVCYEKEEQYLSENAGIVYEGFGEALKELSKNYRLFVVSNCQSGYIELMNEKTGFGKYFEDFTCYGDTNLFKAQNIKLIVEKHGLKNPIYVGDTQMDADACKEAGVPICFCAYGFGKIAEPFLTINTPMEMLSVIR